MSIGPGCTMHTRTLDPPVAARCQRAKTAAERVLGRDVRGEQQQRTLLATDTVATTVPPERSRCGSAARTVSTAPMNVTATVRSKSAGEFVERAVASHTGVGHHDVDATEPVGGLRDRRFQRGWSATSATSARACPPSRSTWRTASASPGWLRAISATFAPSRANRLAASKPMPPLAPVMTTRRPAGRRPVRALTGAG